MVYQHRNDRNALFDRGENLQSHPVIRGIRSLLKKSAPVPADDHDHDLARRQPIGDDLDKVLAALDARAVHEHRVDAKVSGQVSVQATRVAGTVDPPVADEDSWVLNGTIVHLLMSCHGGRTGRTP